MSDIAFDLTKKAEKIQFFLEKKGVMKAPTMRVCAGLDISASMDPQIPEGLQHAIDQLGGIGIKFDDNGEIDMWKFDDRSDYIGVWTPADYQTYCRTHRIQARGGTSYSPLIRDITDHMFAKGTKIVQKEVETAGFFGFGKKKVVQNVEVPSDTPENNDPVLAMIITDGEPASDSQSAIDRALEYSRSMAAYFTFVGVGRSSFPTLTRLEREHSNVGFVSLANFGMSDDDVYKALITDKLVGFLKQYPA